MLSSFWACVNKQTPHFSCLHNASLKGKSVPVACSWPPREITTEGLCHIRDRVRLCRQHDKEIYCCWAWCGYHCSRDCLPHRGNAAMVPETIDELSRTCASSSKHPTNHSESMERTGLALRAVRGARFLAAQLSVTRTSFLNPSRNTPQCHEGPSDIRPVDCFAFARTNSTTQPKAAGDKVRQVPRRRGNSWPVRATAVVELED